MEGRLVLDRFRLSTELGRGGFGTVYRATDERLQRQVAVKALAGGPDARRVLREAQAAARLNHPSIVTLYEIGEDERAVYLVSELVDGESLRTLIDAGAISDRDVCEIGIELCEALAHAHERGVVHRDVKPENVAVSRSREARTGPWSRPGAGRAMLMDFGIASLAGESAITRTGEVVGTLAYMAPEQAEGERAGPAADLYSLALVLYEAWSGRNPVAGPTPAATARAIGSPLPPLERERADLPRGLTTMVDACLDPDPTRRPAALELRAELAVARPELDATEPVPTPMQARDRGGSRWRPLTRVAALAALAACLAWIGWQADRPGLALVLAVLTLPAPLLLQRAREWAAPLAAPALGAVGLAPLYPGIAGIAAGPRRCAILALLGWCWLAVGEAVLGRQLLFGVLDVPPPGWQESPSAVAEHLLAPLLAPASIAPAAAWAAAAALLAALLRSRSPIVRVVGSLGWGAGLVAVHRVLAGDAPDPATAGLVAVLAATLAVGIWLHSPGRGRIRLERGPGSRTAIAPDTAWAGASVPLH